jgi:hypothetical protein
MTTAFAPQFSPVRTFTHHLMGKVDVYVMRRNTRVSASGIQAEFLGNNAEPNRRNHYALKLYSTASEAFAAYQRQNVAAAAGAAPPVRRMVMVMRHGSCRCGNINECTGKKLCNGNTMWGYQTCVAARVGVTWGVTRHGDTSDAGIRKLYATMRKLNTIGTQRDDKPLGVMHGRKYLMLCDLHGGNIGFWRKSPVVIDFGSDIINIGL